MPGFPKKISRTRLNTKSKSVWDPKDYFGETVAVSCLIFDNNIPDEASQKALQYLSSHCNCILLVRVSSEEERGNVEDKWMTTLKGATPRKNILCYKTDVGKQAMMRHLTPSLYIDSDLSVLDYLEPYVKKLVCINPQAQKSQEQTRYFSAPHLSFLFKSLV